MPISFAKEHNLREIDARLTYYQMDTGEIRNFQKHFA